jgi:hypothetical protein
VGSILVGKRVDLKGRMFAGDVTNDTYFIY